MIVLVFKVLLTSVVVLLSSFIAYCLYLRRNHYWAGKPIPSDPPVALFGSVFGTFLGKSLHEIDVKLYKKYGRIFGAHEGTRAYLSVSDPELLRLIYVKDFHIFHTRRDFKVGHELLDNMLTSIKGDEKWRNIRNTITPVFSTGKLRNMLPLMSDCAKCTLNNFEKYSSQNQTVDVTKLFGNFALDIIANVAFGTKLDSHNDPDNEFVTHARKIFNLKFNLKLFIAFVFPKVANFTGINIFPRESVDFFSQVVDSIVKTRLKTKETRHDFLQMMIDSKQAGEKEDEAIPGNENGTTVQTVDQIKRKPLTDLDFRAQTIMFFLAGYETTATTITLASYFLALNPDIQKKTWKEVDAIWNKKEVLDAESMHEAKYIEAVISETLRLCPPATRSQRTASQDYVLGDTEITIPKGMVVEIPVYAIQHDAENFPDPEEFRPERFLNDEVKPYTYLPFGAGPRNCIAMRLALTEAKLCLLHVLRRFELSVCDETLVPMQFKQSTGLLQPKNVILKVTERSI